MNMKQKSIVATSFLVIMGVLFFGMALNYMCSKAKNNSQNADMSQRNASLQTFDTNWEELYPFADSNQNIESNIQVSTKSNLYESMVSYYKKCCLAFTSFCDGIIDDWFILKDEDALYWYGKINRVVGMRFIKDQNDTTVDIGNGYLSYLSDDGTDNSVAIQNTIVFSNWLKQRGIDFLFVSAPSKVVDEKNSITNINVSNIAGKEKLCTELKENSVDVFNISDYMPTDYDEYLSYFYKTDHHWKTEIGFWAAGLIAQELNCRFEFDIDNSLLEPTQYRAIEYPKLFLGSQGRKVGLGYTELEDFCMLLPVFDNHLHVYIPEEGIDTDGDFLALINNNELEYSNPYKNNPYSAYTYGDQPLIQLTNDGARCKKSILILKDSFADPVVPYLALVCEKVDVIDLRGSDKNKCFSGSLKSYINQNKYDIVIDITKSTGAEPEQNNTESLWYFE